MSEPATSGLYIKFEIPVYKSEDLEGQHEIDLSEIDRDRFISTRQGTGLPEDEVNVQREVHNKGRFVSSVTIGHPVDPLSYLGLDIEDDVRYLDNNQISNLLKAYAPNSDWKYDQWEEGEETNIKLRGPGSAFLECAEKRAEQDDREPDDVLLIWESHPHVNSREVRKALVEYDEGYKSELRD